MKVPTSSHTSAASKHCIRTSKSSLLSFLTHGIFFNPECSTFYRVNVTGQRKSLKHDLKFHAIHAIIRYSDYST